MLTLLIRRCNDVAPIEATQKQSIIHRLGLMAEPSLLSEKLMAPVRASSDEQHSPRPNVYREHTFPVRVLRYHSLQ